MNQIQNDFEAFLFINKNINKNIKNYINDNALATGTEVAAVFAEGELKGLYAQEVMSRFKTMYLERDGYKPEEIEIKTLKIDKLQDQY